MKLSGGGAWLSAKNDPECDGSIITFKDEGVWRESTRFTYDDGNPVKQLIFVVDYNGEDRQLSLIKPSRDAMMEAFGDDTIEWVGKQAKVALALNTKGGKSVMLTPIVPDGTTKQEPSVNLDTEGNSEAEIPF